MTAAVRRSAAVVLPFLAGFLVMMLALLSASADAGPPGVSVAYAPEGVDDVFSAGRRVGLVWLAFGFLVVIAIRWTVARLKPRPPAPGKPAPKPNTVRARLIVALTGLGTVVAAAIDMYAASRGMAPLALAVGGALGMYFALGDDPERGSKRLDTGGEAEGDVP
jgi:hypothetical protein